MTTQIPRTGDELLTINEAARALYIDRSTVRRWIDAGKLEGVRMPAYGKYRVHRVRRSAVDAILQGGTQ